LIGYSKLSGGREQCLEAIEFLPVIALAALGVHTLRIASIAITAIGQRRRDAVEVNQSQVGGWADRSLCRLVKAPLG
jgi:hypothetical protein